MKRQIIFKDEAIESIRRCVEIPTSLAVIAIGAVSRMRPLEDFAHIVRCEHCESYDHGYCPTLKARMDPIDFCSYGKRRGEHGET